MTKWIQWFIHVIIVMVFMKSIMHFYGFEEAVILGITMLSGEVVLLKHEIQNRSKI